MSYGSVNADVIGTSVQGYSLGAGNSSLLKNKIINGSMVIDQRNAGASVTPANLAYTLDRWNAFQSVASKYSVQQNAGSVTPPVGFTNYLGVTSLSAYSVAAGDYFALNQPIEGFNIADLGWGTANAKTITLSFQVYSSLTGTFGGALKNSASNRSYPFTYTISSANTWTAISITIAGDTTGTWVTNNGVGIYVQLGLGCGSTWNGTAGSWSANNYISATGATSVVGTNGATLYITGVQLEVGSSATGYEYRQYQQELALCQRYYQTYTGTPNYMPPASGVWRSSTRFDCVTILPVVMRSTPTITAVSVGNINVYSGGSAGTASGISDLGSIASSIGLNISTTGGGSAGAGGYLQVSSGTAGYTLSAEL